MAIDKKLQIFDDEGNPVDYDILASDVKFLPDGKDLPTKLAEMEQEIEDAGSGDGTVKGVKMNNGSPIEPDDDGVVNLGTVITQHQDISGKVDKNGTDSLMSAAEHTKLAGIEAGAEKNIIKGIKANGASTNLPVDQDGVVELPPAGSTISPATASPSMDGTANVGSSAKYAREDHVHPHDTSKQDTLTFDTTPTAGHTTQVMSSDAIKTAIDFVTPTIDENGKWRIGGVTTNHDAHGPMGNITIEDGEDMVALIVNDLTTGGEANFLSAEMGKALLSVLLQIFGNLGEYAFPNGKPTLNFNTQISFPISYSQSDMHVTYADGQGNTAPTTVELLGRLEIQLGTDNDLYVIDEDSVKVFVGTTEVSGAYDPTTDKIIIPQVFGNVAIIANAMTYVQDDLVLHLDYRHMGGTGSPVTNHWKSLVNYNGSPIDFALNSGVSVITTGDNQGVVFDGSANAYGESDAQFNQPANNATIECVASGINSNFNCILVNPINKAAGLSIHNVSAWDSKRTAVYWMGEITIGVSQAYLTGDNVTNYALSVNDQRGYNKGIALEFPSSYGNRPFLTLDTATQTKLTLGARFRSGGNNMLSGIVRSIRVYNSVLTADKQLKNWKVDKKRFNL